MGKAFNELKQGEPAIERLFNLTNFRPQVPSKSKSNLIFLKIGLKLELLSIITQILEVITAFFFFKVMINLLCWFASLRCDIFIVYK